MYHAMLPHTGPFSGQMNRSRAVFEVQEQAAGSSSKQQAAAATSDSNVLATVPRLNTCIKLAENIGEQRRITRQGFCALQRHVARSMGDFVSKNGRFGAAFRTIVLKTHDNRWSTA